MSPVSTFHFWNAAEIADSRKNSSYLSKPGAGNQLSATEAKSISQGEFSSQSTVTSIKTENWGSGGGSDHFGFESSSRVVQSHQDSSPTSIDRSSLLGVTSLAGNSIPASSIYGENMYSASGNTQAEALQTLYLMNPGYGGGFSSQANANNMVMFNGVHGGGQMSSSPFGHPDQQQHQFVKINHNSSQPMTTEPQLTHQAHMVSMQNAEIGHHPNHSDFYQSRGNPVYNWNGGNGQSFIPPSHVSEDNQAVVKQSSDMSSYGNRSIAPMGYHEQASLFQDNVTGHGMNIENLHASSGSGAGQILSLSLSSQQPAMMQQMHPYPLQHSDSTASFFHGSANPGSENGGLNKEVMLLNKCGVNGAYPMQAGDNLLGMGYSNPANSMDNTRQMGLIPGHFGMASFQSKYLRPAQDLLNEIVSIGNCLKNTSLKPTKAAPSPQPWIGSGPANLANDTLFAQEKSLADISSKSAVNWSDKKEGDSIITAVPIGGTGINQQQQSTSSTVELSAAERQELQAKRAKLIGMRDEVDRRYKQYYHQMQTVVASFEAAAGLGAATSYTALALQTISKHFRCLRDAITGQIQATCKALGEEDVSGMTKGETSKLRLIGQQLRQQRALRQLGMMQQQAWRPQRGLPEHAVSVLRAWLFEHFLHPYPKDADKILLARQTGLTRNQVSNWFINARVRLWKPMVEEMYLEEVKEAEGQAEKSGKDEGEISEGGTPGIADGSEIMCKPAKQPKLSTEESDFTEGKNLSSHAPEALQARDLDGSTEESLGIMKPKSVHPDTSSLLPLHVNYKNDGVDGDVLDHEIKMRSEDNYREAYGIGQNGFVQTDQLNLSGYGSYPVNGMNRYSQEAFPANYPSNGAVSLTLGLQHCEGSPFSGSQQHYAQNHGNLPPARQDDDGNGSLEYYTLNDSSYDAFNRKPFPPHMLRRDFVV